jgi:hypothetical protein
MDWFKSVCIVIAISLGLGLLGVSLMYGYLKLTGESPIEVWRDAGA